MYQNGYWNDDVESDLKVGTANLQSGFSGLVG
jgi:hypothetical protein